MEAKESRTPRQQKSQVSSAIDNHNQPEVPLDYSFMDLDDPSDIESLEPRAQPGKKIVKVKDAEDNDKYNAKCLRLNNNRLVEMRGFIEGLDKFILNPQAITWLDLSFNELTIIDAQICDLRSLQILYMHANNVADIGEIDKLAGMPSLRKLALHGNPIENIKNYKCHVLCTIPQLQSLDMSTLTKADRATADTWKKINPQSKKRRKQKD